MFKGKNTILLLMASLVLCLPLLAPATAGAYCVYNHTNVTLEVCAGGCSSCMNKIIEPGQHTCCPGGDRGCDDASFVAFDIIYGHHWYSHVGCGGWRIDHAIDRHGWVTLSGTCTDSFKACGEKQDQACDVTYVFHNRHGHVTHHGKAGYNDTGCSSR